MSYRKEQQITAEYKNFLVSLDEHNHAKGLEFEELVKLYRKIIKEGMSGLCFSMYEEGQEPGDNITEEQ
ncbi:MAG: glycosyl hydrolase, partial [Psychroflexus sp.]|nr:glycosyl hydrolase [Psychroflexus sp.]